MLERGAEVDHATINRWVVKYSPELECEFRKHKKKTNAIWRADETYIKVKGKWYYHYRAVDKLGATLDFVLLKNRDKKAAIKFFKKMLGSNCIPDKITFDKSGSNKAALDHINFIFLFCIYLWIRILQYRNQTNKVSK